MCVLESKSKKTKSKKSVYSAGSLTTSGVVEETDIWLIKLSEQFNRACDYFWTKTAERRRIQSEFRKNCNFIGNKYES